MLMMKKVISMVMMRMAVMMIQDVMMMKKVKMSVMMMVMVRMTVMIIPRTPQPLHQLKLLGQRAQDQVILPLFQEQNRPTHYLSKCPSLRGQLALP